MSLTHKVEREKIEQFVRQYDTVSGVTDKPILDDVTEVNNVQEGRIYLRSPHKFIKVIKDYKQEVYAFYFVDENGENCLDVVEFGGIEQLLKN